MITPALIGILAVNRQLESAGEGGPASNWNFTGKAYVPPPSESTWIFPNLSYVPPPSD